MVKHSDEDLPSSDSPCLVLRHPTAEECTATSTNTSATWKDSLTPALFLEESRFLTTVPLACNRGMTMWILVHRDQAPGERRILCSCESFYKRSLTSDTSGAVSENMVHGIASVFCPSVYRGRGYAARMMRELAKTLQTWQTEEQQCVGNTLYSDIGKQFYTKLGWLPSTRNSQIELQPNTIAWPSLVVPIMENELGDLCKRDEEMVRLRMSVSTREVKTRFTILPDLDHMLWHISKETFATEYLFDKVPDVKGAIAGPPGSQIWALWTHRYYCHPNAESLQNVLYILRLVVEIDETSTRLSTNAAKRPGHDAWNQQMEYLRAVLQAAQVEAENWKLDVVKLWDPTPLVLDMLAQIGMEYEVQERENDSIASLLWYDTNGGINSEAPLWLNNEHYAWQ
ncbi:uncharacterized protein ALTATR162_LOCUS3047 [Alternaria atra]|uniref:LYC1 C-terminal domain-containing protein n=1 Tax=Alternaria atra TaxID=119953 RepID=A0A8J2N3U7_9PLEO|nr:uncharacterized protein ALTATR162_LOCUS3047 [Alternaria atra]CAG5153132.1 unnamed protein product [Alternaria atra]